MTETPAETITGLPDGPEAPSSTSDTIPEARGPHLPDTVTRLGALVWVFLLLAVARLIWFVRESPPVAPVDLATIVTYGAAIVPSVVVVLLPAALLLRQRDAPGRARTLLLGTVLFVLVEGMRVLNPPLQPVFEQLTPGSAETPYLVPLALIYNGLIGLLGSYAVANIALGLARARRYEDPPGAAIVTAIVVVAVSLVAAGGVIAVSQLPLDEIPMTPTVILYLVSTVILSTLFAASWAYLSAVTIRGARAGELPASGWTAAALGGGLIIAAYTMRAVLIVFTVTPETQPLFTSLDSALSVTVALGYVGLLIGFLLGLPSLDEVDGVEDDDAAAEAGVDVEPA
jgi:hypothetical protein